VADEDAAKDGVSESTAPEPESDAGQAPEADATEAEEPQGGEPAEGPQGGEPAEEGDVPAEEGDVPAEEGDVPRGSGVRLALVLALIAVLALGGLVGWLGYRAYEARAAQQQRNLFVQVGRQAAVNLTTISFTEADKDVQRILDSATGSFYDDFQKRSPAFIEVVKQAKAKSEGTVTEAGLEAESGDQAKVLVAVTVKTSNAGAPDQQPRAWRMRIDVQKVGGDAKVSQVEFVP
jgi:Mce-associated membrane protein